VVRAELMRCNAFDCFDYIFDGGGRPNSNEQVHMLWHNCRGDDILTIIGALLANKSLTLLSC
jgi:hypothetical protein